MGQAESTLQADCRRGGPSTAVDTDLLEIIDRLGAMGFRLSVWHSQEERDDGKPVEIVEHLSCRDPEHPHRRVPDSLILPLMAKARVVRGYLRRLRSPFFDGDRRLALECSEADDQRLREHGDERMVDNGHVDWTSAVQGEAPIASRPAVRPSYGLTRTKRIVELVTLQNREWDKAGITSVTGLVPDGWTAWHPVEPSDRERSLAARKEMLKAARAERRRSRRRTGSDPTDGGDPHGERRAGEGAVGGDAAVHDRGLPAEASG